MLEYYEVLELEKKWTEYNKKRNGLVFLGDKFKKLFFKLDKTIFALLLIISTAAGGIIWIMLFEATDTISMAQINQNIEILDAISKSEQNISYNIKTPENLSYDQEERTFLKLNDIGIQSSEDSGGFIMHNESDKKNTPKTIEKNLFDVIPKDEIINFGNAPLPPKSNFNESRNIAKRNISDKILIKTSNLNETKASLEEKFYSTNDILYSIKLAEEAYNSGNYDNAIKWALVSNELDKDSVKSWIIFAKANYKKGRKNDALFSLESFNNRSQNKEVEATIRLIKEDAL